MATPCHAMPYHTTPHRAALRRCMPRRGAALRRATPRALRCGAPWPRRATALLRPRRGLRRHATPRRKAA
eukprot:8141416-Lingulodinium_polyedra.AAC.1